MNNLWNGSVDDPTPLHPELQITTAFVASFVEIDRGHCKHDFLCSDIDEKGNRYWCKICDERFINHPDTTLTNDEYTTPDLEMVINNFKSGIITLQDGMDKLCVSLKEWTNLLDVKKTCKVDEFTSANVNSNRRVTIWDPVHPASPRYSCSQEIDSEIKMGISTKDALDRFPDIEYISYPYRGAGYAYFIDRSVQRVER